MSNPDLREARNALRRLLTSGWAEMFGSPNDFEKPPASQQVHLAADDLIVILAQLVKSSCANDF
jgi:hypothetical protein